MARQQRSIVVIATTTSVVVHAVLLLLAQRYADSDRTGLPATASPTTQVATLLTAPPDPPAEMTPLVLGADDGTGNAANASALADEAFGHLADQWQAALQRQAAGAGGRQAPADAALPPTFTTPTNRAEAALAVPSRHDRDAIGLPGLPPPRKAVPPAADTQAKTDAPPTPTPPADAQAAANRAPGRPIEQADRDSDLFGPQTAVEIRAGKVVAARGRAFKFARPDINLAGFVDAATISWPASLVVWVRVDPAGAIEDVKVKKSTGSSSLDRAFVLAMYRSSFSPIYDKQGKPLASAFDFPITIY